ncbi:MAG: DUF2167 domain-containing protein [Dongiaceae bacterium]
MRVLGRNGVLGLNVVASVSSLEVVHGRIDEILGLVQFNPGNTYAEFDPDTDKRAANGLTGLIAGGVLAKNGILQVAAAFAGRFQEVHCYRRHRADCRGCALVQAPPELTNGPQEPHQPRRCLNVRA